MLEQIKASAFISNLYAAIFSIKRSCEMHRMHLIDVFRREHYEMFTSFWFLSPDLMKQVITFGHHEIFL